MLLEPRRPTLALIVTIDEMMSESASEAPAPVFRPIDKKRTIIRSFRMICEFDDGHLMVTYLDSWGEAVRIEPEAGDEFKVNFGRFGTGALVAAWFPSREAAKEWAKRKLS